MQHLELRWAIQGHHSLFVHINVSYFGSYPLSKCQSQLQQKTFQLFLLLIFWENKAWHFIWNVKPYFHWKLLNWKRNVECCNFSNVINVLFFSYNVIYLFSYFYRNICIKIQQGWPRETVRFTRGGWWNPGSESPSGAWLVPGRSLQADGLQPDHNIEDFPSHC